MRRPSREINIFSLSILDIFASAMGAFMLLMIILIPYFMNTTKVEIKKMDLVFVMDTTGSMEDEIEDLTENLSHVVLLMGRLAKDLRVGFVAYRDEGERYLTREVPLTAMDSSGVHRLTAFVEDLDADGGGDNPEAVEVGLKLASEMEWRSQTRRRIVLIGDAPAHKEDIETCLTIARRFAAAPESRVSSIITSSSPSTSYAAFFMAVARSGRGEYVEGVSNMALSILLSVLEAER